MSVPGLLYYPAQLTTEDQARVLTALDGLPWHGVTASPNSRRVQHYGFYYDYRSRQINTPAPALPEALVPLRDYLTHLTGVTFNQCIVNDYQPGQGISEHTDDPRYGAVIGCYSLGSGTTKGSGETNGSGTSEASEAGGTGGAEMTFSRGETVVPLYLEAGSLYIMTGEARSKWKHGMVGRKSDMVMGSRVERGRRVSVTFRSV